jgi:glutamine amidotransferase-like uncharacterized protein
MTMGKAADNEQIKQKASWLNNVSVSLFVGGFAIPYISLFQKKIETGVSDFATAATAVLVWAAAAVFRWRAIAAVKKIKD